jgi:hypothetical protein
MMGAWPLVRGLWCVAFGAWPESNDG